MSRTYSATRNKHQKQSKVNYQEYFNHPNEPREHLSADISPELEAELLEDIGPMRQEFRRLAHRMRNRHA